MILRRRRLARAGLIVAIIAAGAGNVDAQSPGPSPEPARMPPATPMSSATMESRAARRFPQPVQVGTLIGRALLQPLESQPILGHVAEVVRLSGGELGLVVRLDGGPILPWLHWAGLGDRLVLVPMSGVALLGEYVALMDLTPAQLDALPDYRHGSASAVTLDDTIRVGIVKPFH